jgi:hypothetical protein
MNIMKRIGSSFVVGGGSALLPHRRTSSPEIDTPRLNIVSRLLGAITTPKLETI